MQKNTKEYIIQDEKELDEIEFNLLPWDRIFFYGDLGAGKSTTIRSILRKYLDNQSLIVRSPTYIYYQKYVDTVGQSIFHCDLYRLEDYSTWVSIGGEEILQDDQSIFLIEWPEILADTVTPTKKVSIELMETWERKISVLGF